MTAELASTRLGMLTPSSNTVLEPLTAAMLADLPDASAHFGRFSVLKISMDADALGQFTNEPMLAAADLLAHAKVQSICWNGTSSGWLGFDTDRTLIAEIEARTGIAACSSILAMNELLGVLNARRIAFVTPYLPEIQDRILANYRQAGFEVAAERHLKDPGNFSFATYSEAEILDLCRTVAGAKPDAIAIYCTNFRGARLAPIIEAETGIPVLDSVSTALWKSMKVAGDDPGRIRGWGAFSMSERDLVGYAGTPPRIIWPNGARLAVSVVVNFEEGAENQVGDGDAASERVGEVLSVVPEGRRDQGQEQIFAYGSRVGLWRFLDALEATKTPTTFYMCGRAVVRSPQLAKAIADAGHETACHGWIWRPHADYPDATSERTALNQATRAIEEATGQRPLGFFCRGSESDWTRDLLAEAGYVYTSNAFDDDLPYGDESGLIVVPYNLDTNDMKFFHPNGFARAAEMVDYVRDAIEQLLIEARKGKSSTLSIGFHLRITGRPARFRAVTEILEYLASLEGQIWRARRIDIARHFAETHARGQTIPEQGAPT